jgi:endoglucanase
MDEQPLTFLTDLLEAPSPSGYEQPVQKVVRGFAGAFADEVKTDWHGNVYATVNPEGRPRIMLDGHCDQIGLMVKHIDDEGFLRITPIGGWDVQMLLGQPVVVWSEDKPVAGVVARKAIHLLTPDERKTVPEIKDLWVDIGARTADEARDVVTVGDPVTLQLGLRRMRNNYFSAAGIDNKVGVWVVMTALERIAQRSPEASVVAVSTVQEEIGLRGTVTSAYEINPDLGIAVDVTHATDCPTVTPEEHGLVRVGAGPVLYRGPNVNPVIFRKLSELAEAHGIDVQPNGLSKAASNDAAAMQLSRGGVATGLVAIPNRYMHSPVEVASLRDIENAAELIAQFCMAIDSESDFTP